MNSARDNLSASAPKETPALGALGTYAPEIGALLASDPPTSFLPLQRLLACDPNEPDQVTQAIESNPALTARVLSVVNSAAFGTRHEVKSAKHAVVMLGAKRTRTLAMSYALRLLVSADAEAPSAQFNKQWRSSLAKAEAAQTVAMSIQGCHPDTAQTAALLQDLGLGYLLSIDPAFYSRLCANPTAATRWSELEHDRFGIDHAALTVALLEKWGVGENWIDQLRDHHRGLSDHDQAEVAIPRITAAILPHFDEPMDEASLQWLISIHAKFLADRFSTPESFLLAVDMAINDVTCEAASNEGDEQTTVSRMFNRVCEQVAQEMENLSLQLAVMESSTEEHSQNFDALRSAAFTDPLTSVLNRRGFLHLARRRLEQAEASGVGCCLMFFDLNKFKQVNDRFGHEAGDLMLRGLAKLLRRSVDRHDLIGRMGGDEFAVFLNDVSREEAIEVAQRIRQICLQTRVRISEQKAVAILFAQGVCHAGFVPPNTEIESLIKTADKAMYRAKQTKQDGMVVEDYRSPGETALGYDVIVDSIDPGGSEGVPSSG